MLPRMCAGKEYAEEVGDMVKKLSPASSTQPLYKSRFFVNVTVESV